MRKQGCSQHTLSSLYNRKWLKIVFMAFQLGYWSFLRRQFSFFKGLLFPEHWNPSAWELHMKISEGPWVLREIVRVLLHSCGNLYLCEKRSKEMLPRAIVFKLSWPELTRAPICTFRQKKIWLNCTKKLERNKLTQKT